MPAHARLTDPTESATAFNADHARLVVEAVSWLYTLGPASDEQIVNRYVDHLDAHPSWPMCAAESVRKRCSDARRLDRRIQKVGTTQSTYGKTVGVYGFVAVAS
jgi:hypothetical protein